MHVELLEFSQVRV